jgi:hypothetical protein
MKGSIGSMTNYKLKITDLKLNNYNSENYFVVPLCFPSWPLWFNFKYHRKGHKGSNKGDKTKTCQ